MTFLSLAEHLKTNSYFGRGIVLGKSPSGKYACLAYFIMGRSLNSRNRIFVKSNEGVSILPFDPTKVTDPSLIVYSPLIKCGNSIVLTNGNQTQTIVDAILEKKPDAFVIALNSRSFEPDSPNFTPRISGIVNLANGDFDYRLSILKCGDKQLQTCDRYFFDYKPVCGKGHFIHTYSGDGNPLPSFEGEPTAIQIEEDIDEFTNKIWDSLDKDNKISLLTMYVDISTKQSFERIINKNL
ncbi:MAG: IMP cyclohydrolase [Clostridia bacterium]